jgi:hypothetical protein
MLFALPAVRNVQPGNPPIGCTADFIAFFWGLGLITAASLILILNYIKTYKGEPWAPGIVKKSGVKKGQSAVVLDVGAPESVSRVKEGDGEEIPLHALKTPVRYTV